MKLPGMTFGSRLLLGALALVFATAAILVYANREPRPFVGAQVITEQERPAPTSASNVPASSSLTRASTQRSQRGVSEHVSVAREHQEPHTPEASQAPAIRRSYVSGRQAVQRIDWDRVGPRSSIPREMPAQESDDPIDAGFAREWVERALTTFNAETFIHKGRSLTLDTQSFVLQLIGERKRPDDTWAYAVEYELRIRLRETLGEGAAVPVRVFCNAHGCLCYFEGMTHLLPLGTTARIIDEPWARDFGIEPLSLFVTNGGKGPKEFHWQLAILVRKQSK